MPTVQIKNVPEDVHRVIRRRAAEAGQSMQEYTLALLSEHARQPTLEEVVARIDQRSGSAITMKRAAELIRTARDAQ